MKCPVCEQNTAKYERCIESWNCAECDSSGHIYEMYTQRGILTKERGKLRGCHVLFTVVKRLGRYGSPVESIRVLNVN